MRSFFKKMFRFLHYAFLIGILYFLSLRLKNVVTTEGFRAYDNK
ncbi:hypothetical protein D2M30_1960 [Bacillus amyloliquefaciens]|nr:hypothetical protein D2M30_1960 [Bacillus amyloliquefaciens]